MNKNEIRLTHLPYRRSPNRNLALLSIVGMTLVAIICIASIAIVAMFLHHHCCGFGLAQSNVSHVFNGDNFKEATEISEPSTIGLFIIAMVAMALNRKPKSSLLTSPSS